MNDPVMGALLFLREGGCATAMRVIGKISLSTLAGRAEPAVRQAVLAVHAELEAANWRSASEAAKAFPDAQRFGPRFVIALDAAHCAVVILSCRSKTAVVEFAGPNRDWAAPVDIPWSKSA